MVWQKGVLLLKKVSPLPKNLAAHRPVAKAVAKAKVLVLCQPPRLRRLRSDKGLLKNSTSSSTALRRLEARRNAGSFVKTIRALIARSPDIRTGNARHPGTGPRKATLLKVRDLPRKRINDGVYPRQGLTLPRGPVKILYQVVHEIFHPTAETSRARSETPDILLASDDSSSLVKNGSPDDTEMGDEVVDQVDAVIAALQKYRDKEPEVSPPYWYGYSPGRRREK